MSSSNSEHRSTPRRFQALDQGSRGVGIRNRVLVLPSVICSQFVADRIADRVPETVSAPHDHGCAQLGSDNEQTKRTLVGVGKNPNVAGSVVVGLGCEAVQSEDIARSLEKADIPVKELSIQGVGGTDACVEQGVALAEELKSEQRAADSTPATLGDLTIGVVSSDLRPSTLETANPLVGQLVDEVIDAGGRVLVSGTERLAPHRDGILEESPQSVREKLGRVLDRHRELPSKSWRSRAAAANSSLDEVTAIHGSHEITEVVDYGDSPSFNTGLGLLRAPSRVEEATTGFAAAGAHLVVHVTNDGIPTGHPIVPVLKVTGNSETYAALSDDIDVNANNESVADLLELVIDTANGNQTCSERHGLHEFAISRVGPSM